MFLTSLFRRRELPDAAHALYGAAVARAREPVFYRDLGVPDTLEGRFEMISCHVVLILHRLKGDAAGAGEGALAQAVFDLMFADMDRNLREMGVGDLGVGRRVKTMARALYGRIKAYEKGLAEGEGALAGAIQRNVFNDATGEPGAAAHALARDMAASAAVLAGVSAAALARGDAAFAPLPGAVAAL